MFALDRNLKLLKEKLKCLNKNNFDNINSKVHASLFISDEIQNTIQVVGLDLDLDLKFKEGFWIKKSKLRDT